MPPVNGFGSYDRDLDPYESCSIEIPSIPPRSILYSIPPIGLGTGDVEGLTSYICRLAEAHCVSPTNLLRYQNCSKIQPIFAAKTRVGRCSHCHAWLGVEFKVLDRDGDRSEERKVWLSWLADRAFAVIAAPKHRPTEAIRQEILDYLNGEGKDDRNALWWQKYSADAPEDRTSDDDRLALLKILAREIPS
jgi:TniQ